MQRLHTVPQLKQFLFHVLAFQLLVHKDDDPLTSLGQLVEHVQQVHLLLVLKDDLNDLVDVLIGGELEGVPYLDLYGLLKDRISHFLHYLRPGGGEEQGLELL